MQARIAVLLGERKGQESLKADLIRRIKMLEYALKQERAKFHILKYGCDPPNSMMNDMKPPADETGIGNEVAPDSEVPFSSVSNTTWRQGRQLLRNYLQEIGYTDTIIDVRSNRVRALLGLNNNTNTAGGGGGNMDDGGGGQQDENMSPSINGNNENNKRASESQGRRTPAKKSQPATVTETEAAVMAALEFLDHTDVEMSDDDEIAEGLEMTDSDDDVKPLKRKTKGIKTDGKFFLFVKTECVIFLGSFQW